VIRQQGVHHIIAINPEVLAMLHHQTISGAEA
jgi:hypothetical protein